MIALCWRGNAEKAYRLLLEHIIRVCVVGTFEYEFCCDEPWKCSKNSAGMFLSRTIKVYRACSAWKDAHASILLMENDFA
jgi:hypothetical protein